MSDKNQVKSERCRKECVMRFSDMHVHSTFSSDGKSSMNEHCEIAKQKKLKSICFTEPPQVVQTEQKSGSMVEN